MTFLHGFHDEGGEHLHADKPGWTVISEAIGSDANDKSGRDYRHLSGRGFTLIVRLNNGYSPAGSIPAPSEYGAFAQRCANFVKASQGCEFFIIANELNHLQEQIPGQPVTPVMYADCFNRCYAAIKAVAPNVQVITAPVAPWDATTKYPSNANGDWIVYFVQVLMGIPHCDGIGLHTYTHGAGVHLITSSARMQPPFQNRRYEFRAYQDFLEAMPPDKRALPIYITETDQVDRWANANTQWVQAAYGEIDSHNKTNGTQKIRCLALYRWKVEPGDKWGIAPLDGVQADFRAAVAKGYQSPQVAAQGQEPMGTHLPSISAGTAPAPQRDIDPRLKGRGVSIRVPTLVPGQDYWRVVKARWYDEKEAQGRHHIYVEAQDTKGKPMDGIPFEVYWPTGRASGHTNGRPGFDAGNFPMSQSRNEFSVGIDVDLPTEVLEGIGMGMDTPGGFNAGIHTSTGVVFQLVTMPAVAVPAQPPAVSTGPTPAPPVPNTLWVRVIAANLRGGPSTEFAILAEIPQGTSLTVTGSTPTRDWYQVRVGNQTGWVFAALLSAQPVSAQPTPAPQEPVQPIAAEIIDPRVLEAILQVESGGRAFGADGKLLIRFEAHIFVGKGGNSALFRFDRQISWADHQWRRAPHEDWRNIHTGSQADEYAAFEFAATVNREAAHESISMGAPQIMGFNAARIGYPSAVAMFGAFSRSQSAQLIGMVNYLLSDPALVAAVKARDWEAIARGYNGGGNVAEAAAKYRAAYDAVAA